MTPPTAAAILAALLLAAVAAGWWRDRRRWDRHVGRVDDALRRIEGGDWRARVGPAETLAEPSAVRGLAARVDRLAGDTGKRLAALDRQRGDLRALVDALPDPILLADTRGKIILFNAPAADLMDVTVDGALGRPLASVVQDAAVLGLFDQADAETVAVAGTGTGAGTEAGSGDSAVEPLHRTLRLARGGARLSYHAVATRTQAGGVLVVLRDVSQLAVAVQMKADFVANASHELRTPLSAIKIAFETLADVYGDLRAGGDHGGELGDHGGEFGERGGDAEAHGQIARCVEIIDGQIRRLEEMLRDLLDLSRVETADLKPHLEPVRAAEVLSALRASLGPVARQKGVELTFADVGGLTVLTDRRLLDLIAKNLVENGVKYTPPGGRVAVSLARHALPPDAAAAHGQLAGDLVGAGGYHEVELVVRDTGVGIPPESVERVFERFYQVDPARSGSAGRGTGLGLAIVKHAAAAMGATVRLDSAVGGGTTVTCTIPQAGDDGVA